MQWSVNSRNSPHLRTHSPVETNGVIETMSTDLLGNWSSLSYKSRSVPYCLQSPKTLFLAPMIYVTLSCCIHFHDSTVVQRTLKRRVTSGRQSLPHGSLAPSPLNRPLGRASRAARTAWLVCHSGPHWLRRFIGAARWFYDASASRQPQTNSAQLACQTFQK